MPYTLVFSVFASALFVLLLKPVAPRVGLVDAPCVRKRHDGAIPLIGGLTIFLAIVLSALLSDQWAAKSGIWMLMLGFPILVIGMLDDRHNLSPRLRFLIEIACAVLAAVLFGICLDSLGALLPGQVLWLGWLAIPFTVIGMVGVINAFNMTDGVDGLAGGLAFLIFSALGFLAERVDSSVAFQLWTFSAAILGFLFFNSRFFGRAKAAIFMGDAGTLFIGFAIAWYLILLSQGPDAVMQPVTALWLFACPLLDTVSVMIRRIRRGQSPFSADREHLHHIFMLAGFGVNGTVLIILAFQLFFIVFGIAMMDLGTPEWISFATFLGVFVAYFWVMSHAWRVMKRIKQFREWAGFECRRRHNVADGRRTGIDRRKEQLAFSGVDRRQGVERRKKSRRGG